MPKNKRYAMVQLPIEEYTILKEYCNLNDKKIGRVVASLIRKNLLDVSVLNSLEAHQKPTLKVINNRQ